MYRGRHLVRRRHVRRLALVAVLAPLAALVPAQVGHAVAGLNVLRGVATFPDGTGAAGAEVSLTTLPPFAGQPELPVGSAVADSSGRFAIPIPATDPLVSETDAQQTLHLLLTLTGQQSASGATQYLKHVEPVVAELEPGAPGGLLPRWFRAPLPFVYGLQNVQNLDPYALVTAGRQTLMDHAEWLLAQADPYVQVLRQALQVALTNEGDSIGTIQAYDVNTAEGLMTYVTDAPDTIVVEPTDDDVWEVVPLTAATPPLAALDTTNEADTVDAYGLTLNQATGDGGGGSGTTPRGTWAKDDKASNCLVIAGPHQDSPRYHRTVCSELDQQLDDTSKTYTYWQFSLHASGYALPGDNMYRLWVEAQPAGHGTAAQGFDGIPTPGSTNSRTEPCDHSTDSFSISSGGPVSEGFGRSRDRVSCETYGPKQYDDQGHWATIWTGNPKVGANEAREVLLIMPIKTKAKDGGPAWSHLTGQWVRSS